MVTTTPSQRAAGLPLGALEPAPQTPALQASASVAESPQTSPRASATAEAAGAASPGQPQPPAPPAEEEKVKLCSTCAA
eukprot:12428550-Alexandrium_andersonii.AAC.1